MSTSTTPANAPLKPSSDERSAMDNAIALPKVMVFVPAYRCPTQIARVIAQFADTKAIPDCIDTIAVFDNQSPDNTIAAATEAFGALKTSANKLVLRNCDNYGLGGSHKAAFRHAVQSGMDYLIVLHGDDQASIADIVPHLRSGEAFKYDCFLGSRFAGGARREGYSAFRTFGNRVYNTLFSIVAGRHISDLGSGLNMYRVSHVPTAAIHGFPDNLSFNYVMLLWSLYKKQTVRFFPITWREEDQASNVKLVQQAVHVLSLLLQRFVSPSKFFVRDHREAPKQDYVSEIAYSSESDG